MFDKHYSVIDDIAARHFYYCYKAINSHDVATRIFVEGFDINKGLPEQIRISSNNYSVANCVQGEFGHYSPDCAILIVRDTDNHKRGKEAYLIPNPFAYQTEELYIGQYENNPKRPTEFALVKKIPFENLNFRALWSKDYESVDKKNFEKNINKLYQVAVVKAFDLVSHMEHDCLYPGSEAYIGVDKAEHDIKSKLKGSSNLISMKKSRRYVSTDGQN